MSSIPQILPLIAPGDDPRFYAETAALASQTITGENGERRSGRHAGKEVPTSAPAPTTKGKVSKARTNISKPKPKPNSKAPRSRPGQGAIQPGPTLLWWQHSRNHIPTGIHRDRKPPRELSPRQVWLLQQDLLLKQQQQQQPSPPISQPLSSSSSQPSQSSSSRSSSTSTITASGASASVAVPSQIISPILDDEDVAKLLLDLNRKDGELAWAREVAEARKEKCRA